MRKIFNIQIKYKSVSLNSLGEKIWEKYLILVSENGLKNALDHHKLTKKKA